MVHVLVAAFVLVKTGFGEIIAAISVPWMNAGFVTEIILHALDVIEFRIPGLYLMNAVNVEATTLHVLDVTEFLTVVLYWIAVVFATVMVLSVSLNYVVIKEKAVHRVIPSSVNGAIPGKFAIQSQIQLLFVQKTF